MPIYNILINDTPQPRKINASGQGVIWITGDSLLRTSESLEAGPEPFRNGIVYKTDSTGSTISEVTNTDIESVTNGSCWPKFGADLYKRTQIKGVFCNSAVGGSEVFNNGTPSDNWSTGGTLYDNGKTKLAATLAAVDVDVPLFIFQSLTINDVRNVTTTEEQIQSALEDLYARINSDFPDVPVMISLLGLEGDGFNISTKKTNVRTIITNAVAMYPNFRIITDLMDYAGTANCTFFQNDYLHLTQLGNDLLGATMVKDLLSLGLLTSNPVSYTYSDIAAVDTVLGFSNFSTANDEEKKALYDYVGYLDAKGDWSKYDSVYNFLFNTQDKSNQDLRRSSKQIAGGGASWTNKSGYTTDGTDTGVIRTNFIPSSDGTATGFISNNNVAGLFIKNRLSGTGVKRTAMGAVGITANRNYYITETDGVGGEFIEVNNCGLESATTGPAGNVKSFDGNRLWLNRRTGITPSALLRFPASYVASTNPMIGKCDSEIIIGGKNNVGTYTELISLQTYGCYFMVGTTTEYVRGARKFRELSIDLLLWA